MHTLMLYLDGSPHLAHLRYRTFGAAQYAAMLIAEHQRTTRRGENFLLDDERRMVDLNACKVKSWLIEPPEDAPALPG